MQRVQSCGAIVFRKNPEVEYLLLQYSGLTGREYWGLVKGIREAGESERETVIRELKEETGITNPLFIEGFRDVINYYYRKGRHKIYKVVIYFLLKTEANEVELSFEHTGYDWLSYQSAFERLSFRNVKAALKKANLFLQNNGFT